MRKKSKIRLLKWFIFLGIMGGIGTIAYSIAMNYASQKVMDEVSNNILNKNDVDELMKEPDVQKLMLEQSNNQALDPAVKPAKGSSEVSKHTGSIPTEQKASSEQPAASPAKTVTFRSKEDALKFLLSKFSIVELSNFAAKTSGGITPEEKKEIKSTLMSRLSPEEYQALKILGVLELKKRNSNQ